MLGDSWSEVTSRVRIRYLGQLVRGNECTSRVRISGTWDSWSEVKLKRVESQVKNKIIPILAPRTETGTCTPRSRRGSLRLVSMSVFYYRSYKIFLLPLLKVLTAVKTGVNGVGATSQMVCAGLYDDQTQP